MSYFQNDATANSSNTPNTDASKLVECCETKATTKASFVTSSNATSLDPEVLMILRLLLYQKDSAVLEIGSEINAVLANYCSIESSFSKASAINLP